MSQEERYGTREATYSAWHRRKSTMRYVGFEAATKLSMIDIDAAMYVEYDDKTKEPLAIMEVARDVGQDIKPATVTRNLARRCNPPMPAYIVLYKLSENHNPADPQQKDIAQFRFKKIWPEQTGWITYTPAQWASHLVMLRHELTLGKTT